LALLSENYPGWREARAELNELPLGAEVWKEQAFCGRTMRNQGELSR
jgi:hypothetical protein